MMRTRPTLALAIASALVAPVALTSAVAAVSPCEDAVTSQVEPFVACGRTTVVGPRGYTLRLHVPSETVLDLSTTGPVDTFRTAVLKGYGPAQGFLLTDNVLPSGGGKYVYAWHLVRGLFSVVQDFAAGSFEQRGKGLYVIPPGDYSLYLISDGNPVTMTLPFEGLPGAASYSASRFVLVDFRILENHVTDPVGTGQDNVWSAGQAGTFRSPGFHAMTWSAMGELADPAAVSGLCYYLGRPENEGTAYLPGCPNTYTEDIESTPLVDAGVYPDTPSQAFTSAFSAPGGRAMGWWRTGVKPLERIAALSYFFELDPAFTA